MKTKSTMTGWSKIKGGYQHVSGLKVLKAGRLWEVVGASKNDGNRYDAMWVAMYAANDTSANFV